MQNTLNVFTPRCHDSKSMLNEIEDQTVNMLLCKKSKCSFLLHFCIILFHWQKNRQSCFLQFLCLVKIAFLQNIFFFCFKYLKLKCCPNVTLKTISITLEILWHTSFEYLTAKKYFFTIGNKIINATIQFLNCPQNAKNGFTDIVTYSTFFNSSCFMLNKLQE